MLPLPRLLAAAFHGLHLLVRPGHLPAIFGLVDAMNTPAQLARMRAHLGRHPRAAAALAAPFHLAIDVDALGGLPHGTLGRAFADFVRQEAIDPAVLTDRALGQAAWIPVHLLEVHDVWHVVLGLGTSVLDEVELLSFMLAQLPETRMAPFAIATALVRGALGHPGLPPAEVLAAIRRGAETGASADLLFGVDWSAHWARPLDRVRAELGVTAREPERAAG